MIDVEHCAAPSFFRNGLLGLALGAYKEDHTPLTGQLADEAARIAEHLEGLLQIDDMNSIAFAEDILLHLRVPAAGLVAEVHTGLQQLLHCNFNCQLTSF